MGFLCINKESQKDVTQEALKEEIFLRNVGLNNVFNLNPNIDVCSEIFYNPEYYVTGATQLVTGLTTNITGCTTGTTGIYNLDYSGNINIDFIITGNTNYTAYTGNFCTKLFSKNNFNPPNESNNFLFEGTEYLSNCFQFSGITGNSIQLIFNEGIFPKTWAEYLIRPYFSFISKDCTPGLPYNSWLLSPQLNGFNNNTDYYFMTVVDPPTPTLQGPNNATPFANQILITDRLLIDGISGPLGPQAINGVLNYFILSSIPSIGQILLVLNGVQLTQGRDFNLIQQSFGKPPIVEVNGKIQNTDWLVATYVSGQPNAWASSYLGSYWIDTILVNGFTTVSTPYYRPAGDNTINYNPITNNYEFFTTYPIDDENSIILTVNGVKLVPNQQFFVSTSFDGRIIFDKDYTTINLNDIISVLYVTKNSGLGNLNYGSLETNSFTAQWSVPTSLTNSTVTGNFVISVYDKNTNNLMFENNVPFVDGQSNYETTFLGLTLNMEFKFVVTFKTTYTGYLNNQVITCSSAEGFFDTTNRYINNTY